MLSIPWATFLLAALPGPNPDAIRASAERAIPRIQASLAEYARKRDCFACHHQGVGLLALTKARSRGLKVDDDLIRDQTAFTANDLHASLEAYQKGRGQGGGATRAGYALWALDLGDHAPDETTAAVADYLLTREHDGWKSASRRPPSESSPFTATYVALRGITRFAAPESKDRVSERVARAREWLLQTPADDTESLVFRLRALKLAEADAPALKAAADDLLKAQDQGGGWPQTADLPPDAYATATALVALHEAGTLANDSPAYRLGLAFLVGSQGADGTWHVETRSRPFQTYFESGFPHGTDQFISMSATSWAVAALCQGLPAAP